MWMMGYNDVGGDFNMADSFNGRKLRPIIPRVPASNSTNTATTNGSPCLSRNINNHGSDFLAQYHHLGTHRLASFFLKHLLSCLCVLFHFVRVCLCLCLCFMSSFGGGAEQEGVHEHAAGGGELEVEPDAGAVESSGGIVPTRDSNPVGGADSAHHRAAPQVRQDRREERLLLVPKPQGQGTPKTSSSDGVGTSRSRARHVRKERIR